MLTGSETGRISGEERLCGQGIRKSLYIKMVGEAISMEEFELAQKNGCNRKTQQN
jgi:hypothetical protein